MPDTNPAEARPRYFTGRFVGPDRFAAARDAGAAPDAGSSDAAEAMLVEHGRIVAIGSLDEVRKPPHAECIDLGEGWALPGLIEPHGHLSESAALHGDGIIDIRPTALGTADGDARLRQVGVKVWSDGSPWVGNIATSFQYLDTPTTRSIGLEPGHVGHANYTTDQLVEIGSQYAGEGWQLACHAHGDLAVDSTLDAYEALIGRFGLRDHRFRIEHCGLMTPPQFARAAGLGVTVSLFVDHIT